MNALRVGMATVAMLICAGFSGDGGSIAFAQYPSTSLDRDAKGTNSDREGKVKERTPPPRPIIPPEGQQENPALREECSWLGQRIVSLLFRDDAMTANDFIPFYLRFGCPEAHLSKAFGCVANIGMAENDALADLVAACWTDPNRRPAPLTAKKGNGEAVNKQPETVPGRPAEPADKPAGAAEKPAEKPAGAPEKPAEPAAKPAGSGVAPADPSAKTPETGAK
ncbi:MAG: hypothetical protein IPK66_07090 [Rhodospirillales bacterium]|nr:hypothetical protein [Rhodospirillales bacterium]